MGVRWEGRVFETPSGVGGGEARRLIFKGIGNGRAWYCPEFKLKIPCTVPGGSHCPPRYQAAGGRDFHGRECLCRRREWGEGRDFYGSWGDGRRDGLWGSVGWAWMLCFFLVYRKCFPFVFCCWCTCATVVGFLLQKWSFRVAFKCRWRHFKCNFREVTSFKSGRWFWGIEGPCCYGRKSFESVV